MKIAITGSKGFIGSRLKKRLLKDNHEIIEIDFDLGYDLKNWNSLKEIKSFEILIHLAAKSYVPDSFNNPLPFYETNVIGTLNALELCRKNSARMIYTSSYVYGSPQYLPIDENHPTSAFNPYAQSKLLGEDLCRGYHRDFQVPIVVLRPFNIYGKGQNQNFLIPKIISQAIAGCVNLEDSRPKRDFVYIDDVIEAYVKAVKYDGSDFDVFNIGSGKSISISQVARLIVDKIGNEIPLNFSDKRRKNEVLETVASIEKARKLLKWVPEKDIVSGISDMIKDVKK